MALQGALDGSAVMRTNLAENGLLPLSHPYGVAPWNYQGTEAVTAIPDGVVDWVLAEVRSGNPNTPPMTSVSRRVGLLFNDGRVAGTVGTGSLGFEGIADGAYHVVIYHRNHIPVMSSASVQFVSGCGTWNFRTGPGQAFGAGAMVNVNDIQGLWASDGNADGQVTAPDFNLFSIGTGTGDTGYLQADYNLDGQVTAPDFNLFIQNTSQGATSQVPASDQP